MGIKELKKDNSGQMGMAGVFIGLAITFIIAMSVVWPVIDQSLNSDGGVASGTYNFTGNSSEGQFVNITTLDIANSGIGGYTMCYYANTTGIGKPIGCTVIDVRSGANTSDGSATALRAAIASDTDISGYVTVTNTSATNVIITANNAGTRFNWGTTDTVTNGGWAASAMTGGAYGGLTNMGTAASVLVQQIPLFLVLILFMVFVKLVL